MSYTTELQDEIDRVTIRGNADKQTIRKLASIIFRMEQRIIALESGKVAPAETPVVEEKLQMETPEAPKKTGSAVKAAKTPDQETSTE